MNLNRSIHFFRMRRTLTAHHADDLDPAARHRVEEHAAICEICAGELRELEEADRRLRDARPTVACLPEDVSQELFARALADSGVLARRERRRWPLLAGAATVTVVCLFAAFGARSTSPELPERESAVAMALNGPHRQGPASETPAAAPSSRSSSRPSPGSAVCPDVSALSRPKALRDLRQTSPALVKVERAASTHGRRGPARRKLRRLVHTRTVAAHPLPVVQPDPQNRLEWRPEETATHSAGELLVLDTTSQPAEVTLLDDQQVRAQIAAGAALQAGLEVKVSNAPEVPAITVEVKRAGEDTPGVARAAAYWSEPSGRTLWKQALVTTERPMAELLLVSLDEERLWGFWKEKLE